MIPHQSSRRQERQQAHHTPVQTAHHRHDLLQFMSSSVWNHQSHLSLDRNALQTLNEQQEGLEPARLRVNVKGVEIQQSSNEYHHGKPPVG